MLDDTYSHPGEAMANQANRVLVTEGTAALDQAPVLRRYFVKTGLQALLVARAHTQPCSKDGKQFNIA